MDVCRAVTSLLSLRDCWPLNLCTGDDPFTCTSLDACTPQAHEPTVATGPGQIHSQTTKNHKSRKTFASRPAPMVFGCVNFGDGGWERQKQQNRQLRQTQAGIGHSTPAKRDGE